ncbi:unnamed protein product [Absidia cylindrospora]
MVKAVSQVRSQDLLDQLHYSCPHHLDTLILLCVPAPLLFYCPGLLLLDKWCHLRQLSITIDDATLVPFLQAHPYHLIGSYNNKSLFTDTMAHCLPWLTTLSIAHNAAITCNAIRRLVCHCPRLLSLRLVMGYFPEAHQDTLNLLAIKQYGLDDIRRSNNDDVMTGGGGW